MKVVVVGTNQKDRERVAKVIKDRYSGLAEENAALLKKLERSNDAWIRGREEIADLETAVKVFQDDTLMRKAHIEHLEGQIANLKEDFEVMARTAGLQAEENERLRVRLRTHGGIETDKEEALRGEEEK